MTIFFFFFLGALPCVLVCVCVCVGVGVCAIVGRSCVSGDSLSFLSLSMYTDLSFHFAANEEGAKLT